MVRSVLNDLLNPATFAGAIFYAVVLSVLAAVAARAVRFAVKESRRLHARLIDETLLMFSAQLVQIGIYVVAFTLYAHLIPTLRSLGTALLTGVSVVSVIIGLAAQGMLANMFGGVALLLYRPFRLGDRVQVTALGGIDTGAVDRITLGYTVLRTLEGRRIVVPNSAMVNQAVVNLTGPDRRVMALVTVQIDQASDIDKARALLLELAQGHRLVREVIGCPVTQLANPGVVLSLRAWCPNAEDAKQAEFDLYEEAKKRFDREHIPVR